MKRRGILASLMLLLALQPILYGQTVFQLRQDAVKLSKSCYKVTEDLKQRAGAIWWPNKVDLSKDLELHFVVYMGDKDAGGADGMAFVFHNDSRGYDAKGERGGGLYIGDHPSQPTDNQGVGRAGIDDKIVPSVALEMDTWQNTESGCTGDPWYDHTAVVYNGDVCNPKMAAKQLHKTKENVEDNTCYNAVIKWSASSHTLQLYFADKDNPTPDLIFTHTDDLVQNVFGGNSMVYYGFTGSTGGSLNEQTICIFDGSNSVPIAKNDYASTLYGAPVTVDVQDNDKDSDGDSIYTTEIVTKPVHGTAAILNKSAIKYSPNAGYAGLDSLEYRICDINPEGGSEKCYSNCSNAWVIINQVECPTFTLIAAKVKDNEKCDLAKPDNGAARAYMWDGTTEITTDFTFKWYKGSFATPAQVAALTPDYVGVTLSNLADGIYTAWAELNQNTKCKALNVANVTIKKDITNVPQFTIALNKSVTNCSPPNGEIQVNFDDPTVKPSDYSIIWYEVYPSKVFIGQIFNKAEVKTYTVEVINLASGCSSIGTINVPKSYTSPVVSKISTPRKSCSTLDGSLSANVGGNTSNYEFRWAVSNDKKMFNPFIGPVYSGLDTGNYWLNIRDKVTGCYYDTISVRVDDNRVNPVIGSFSKTSQTSCNASKPNGTIDLTNIDGGASLGNYDYEWFVGNNTSNPLSSAKYSANKAFDLSAGFYTVKVSRITTDCFTTKLFEIIDEIDAPQIKILTQKDPTKCSPADGEIAVEVDPDGAGPKGSTTSNYTFNWWKGGSVKITTPDYSGSSITSLPAGQYTVQATSIAGCQANITVTLNPLPASAYPSITLTPVDDSSCNTSKPNGKITAVVIGGSGSYKYNWFKGSGLTSPLPAFNNLTVATGLINDTYTLMVTDNGTGCTKIQYVDVNYIPFPAFSVTATKVQDVNCKSSAGVNGMVKADVLGDTVNYSFNWYIGSSVKSIVDHTGSSWNKVDVGIITVVATHKATLCESAIDTIHILDHPPFIITTVINTPSAGCLASSGTLKASASPASSYVYDWFQGVPDMSSYPYFSYPYYALNTDIITNLAPSKYTVRVTDNVTNCVVYKTVDLSSSLPIPEAYLKTPVDNTSCISPNGVLEIDYIVPDPINAPATKVYPDPVLGFPAGYEIYWINGPNRPITLTGPTTLHKYTNLAAGQYVVVVKVPSNSCESIQVSGVIKDDPNRVPVISITKVDQTYCSPFNGSIKVTFTNYTGNPSDYSAVVKRNAVPFPSASLPAIANPWNLTALQNGVYSILITNVNTGCTATMIVTISDRHVNPTRHLSITMENTSCSPTGSGQIDIIAPNLVKEKYNWFKINGTPIGDPLGNDVSIKSLEAGGYYVIVTDRITGCTYKEAASVNDAQVYPTVSVQSVSPRTTCAGFDGSATINLGPNANYTFYTLSWTLPYPSAPAPILGPGAFPNQFVASNLDTGSYVLTATDPLMTCFTSTPFKIGLLQDIPVLDLDSTGVTACIPNGTITANITKGASLYDVILKDLETGAVSIKSSVPANPAPVFLPLLPGEYLATVTDSKGCTSSPTQITIPDKTIKPKLQIVNLNHNSSCTAIPNGFISVTASPINSYSYSWTSLSGSFVQTNDTTITQVKAGKYQVKVNATPGGICADSMEITIRDTVISIMPLISKFDVTRCTYPYDGALIASVNGGTSGYIFTWTNLDSANKQYVGPEFSNLPPANYLLDVIHTVSKCSIQIPVKLILAPVAINVTLTENAPQTNCDPLRPNAQWTASIDGQISGYTFDWYEGNSVTSGKLHYSGITSTKMKAAAYTLRIKDILRGCAKDTTITPSNMPVIIPAPDIDSLRHLTSCITPNGYAAVSVNGNTSDYIFNWYKGSQGSAPIGNPGNEPRGWDYTGYEQTGLGIGSYTVVAISRITGCTSNPLILTIKDNKVYPDFDARTRNSLCSQNDGRASITWIEPVLVDKLEMTNGREVYYSPENLNLPPGEFQVTLTSPEGCVFTKNINIGADFLVYNGISPNGDGKNDIFEIECIELYPKNVVKIFNRAGSLVYIGEGYDNKSVYFEGVGNKGIYTSGNSLPDGTYYYIVDSGDGNKPKAGFFELLR